VVFVFFSLYPAHDISILSGIFVPLMRKAFIQSRRHSKVEERRELKILNAFHRKLDKDHLDVLELHGWRHFRHAESHWLKQLEWLTMGWCQCCQFSVWL